MGFTDAPWVVIIEPMSDDKPKPLDDLKEGLGLLFRAAKGAVESLPTDKLEDAAKDAAKEVGRAFESIGNELDKAIHKVTAPPGSAYPGAPPPEANAHADPPTPAEAPPAADANAPKAAAYDDGYAPEPPKGPRVG